MIQFAVSLVIALLGVAGASIAWPKFSSSPMPAPLSAVHSVVIQTPLGNQLNNVLGASVDSNHPINPQDLAASAASSIVSGVEEKTTEVIIGQLMIQLNRQIEKLPAKDQASIRNAMCAPQNSAQ